MGKRDRERKDRIRSGEEEPIRPRRVVGRSEESSMEAASPLVNALMAGVNMFPSVMRAISSSTPLPRIKRSRRRSKR